MRLIAQISDLHFGRHDPAIVDALVASLRETKPDLVAVCGDFTQRAKEAEFEEARQFLDRLTPPKIVVPGNHDVPLYNLFKRFLAPLASYDHYIAPINVPGSLFLDEEIAVLGLNTARSLTIKNGRVSHEQMAEIRRVFGNVPPGLFRVVVTHHPLGTPSTEDTLELAGRSQLALETIADAGVHLLLSGHHHRASSGEVDAETALKRSALLVHAGTAISTRVRGSDGNTYNLLRIERTTLTVTVMRHATLGGFRESQAASYEMRDGSWRRE